MSVLIKDEGFQADDLLAEEFVPLAEISATDQFLDLSSDADVFEVAKLFGQVNTIRIGFASFSDGRGFSLARRLRALGFTGRLRAFGHLIADQYPHARRCGFDEVAIDESLSQRQPQHQWMAQSSWDQPSYQDRLLRTG